jgi:hypothetical protein
MMVYTQVNKQFAIENGPIEIVDLPIKSMVIFHSCLYVYQRVIHVGASQDSQVSLFHWVKYRLRLNISKYNSSCFKQRI